MGGCLKLLKIVFNLSNQNDIIDFGDDESDEEQNENDNKKINNNIERFKSEANIYIKGNNNYYLENNLYIKHYIDNYLDLNSEIRKKSNTVYVKSNLSKI